MQGGATIYTNCKTNLPLYQCTTKEVYCHAVVDDGVVWCWTYGKGPLRWQERKSADAS